MVSIFDEVLFSDLVDDDGRPAILLMQDISIDPAGQCVLFERAELMIEVSVPIEGANDLSHANVFDADQLPVSREAEAGGISGEEDKF